MGPTRVSPALAVLLVVLSGCAANQGKDGKGTPAPSSSTTVSTPTHGTLEPGGNPGNGSAIPPRLRFENCWGSIPAVDIPKAMAAPYIPAGFSADGAFPETELLSVEVQWCQRVVTPRAIVPNVALLVSVAAVKADNRSWENKSYLPKYVFDFLTNSSALAKELKTWPGPEPQVVDFHRSETPGGTGFAVAHWSFVNAKLNYSVQWTYPTGMTPVNDSYNMHYWFGNSPFYRLDLHQTYKIYPIFSNAQGSLVVTGETPFAKMMGAPASFEGVEAYEGLTHDIEVPPKVFQKT